MNDYYLNGLGGVPGFIGSTGQNGDCAAAKCQETWGTAQGNDQSAEDEQTAMCLMYMYMFSQKTVWNIQTSFSYGPFAIGGAPNPSCPLVNIGTSSVSFCNINKDGVVLPGYSGVGSGQMYGQTPRGQSPYGDIRFCKCLPGQSPTCTDPECTGASPCTLGLGYIHSLNCC